MHWHALVTKHAHAAPVEASDIAGRKGLKKANWTVKAEQQRPTHKADQPPTKPTTPNQTTRAHSQDRTTQKTADREQRSATRQAEEAGISKHN